MKLDIVCNKKDEFYTPPYAITPLLKYIDSSATIWCPFDMEESYFTRIFSKRGNKVIHTHISDGQDFFNLNIESDYIISNPPYSKKGAVFERLFYLKRRFAMLVGVVGLFESQHRFNLFSRNDFEILYFNKRVSFFESYQEQKPALNPPFSSAYVCHGVLPKQIMFDKIDKGDKTWTH